MNILVTGGAGYIGSHTCKLLAEKGYNPITYDNLSTGHEMMVKWGPLEVGDINDIKILDKIFYKYKPEAVVHLAANALVEESCLNPGKYYYNNVGGMLSLLEAMKNNDVKSIVFSSTCAVYGLPESNSIDEEHPKKPISPYGKTKLAAEMMLEDFRIAYGINYVVLRYFNAAGADPDGDIYEKHEPETHLIPLVLNAAKNNSIIKIFGSDYDTPDGTCVRDYIHVGDLAEAHLKAIDRLKKNNSSDFFNLGTGKGHSILEVIKMVEKVTNKKINTCSSEKRIGDPAMLVADYKKACDKLNWYSKYSNLENIIRTAWFSFTKN